MRIIIDMGHTPTSPGASGHLDELYCDRQAGARIIAELERRGHVVYNSTPPDWMAYPEEVNYRCNYANQLSDIDLFVSLHLNAGGGHGTEVLYYSGDWTGASYAARISSNVARSMQLPDRGAKANDWVGVICNTWCTAVLIEFCFVDNWDDAQAWNRTSWDDLVAAVCDGIEGREWNGSQPAPQPQPQPQPKPQPSNIRYRVSLDPDGREWLPEMVGLNDTSGSGDDYAGVEGEPIRWIAVDGVEYQACTDESGWLPVVGKYDVSDLDYGCAGDGSPIIDFKVLDDTVNCKVHKTIDKLSIWR